MRKRMPLVLLFFLMVLLVPQTALARTLLEHQSITVPENETVDDVLVVGGDAGIRGTVKGSVVVLNGSARLSSTAQIEGMVLVIGGKLVQDPGARVADDVIQVAFDDATRSSLLVGGGLALGIWILQLGGSLVLMLVPILLTLLGKQRLQAFVETHKRSSPGRMLSTGLLTGLILGTASLLLLLTVVGIPFILVLGIYPLVSFALGFTVLSHWLGEQMRAASYRSSWIRAAAGALILTSALNLPLLGGILLVGILLFSLGITTVWILSHQK